MGPKVWVSRQQARSVQGGAQDRTITRNDLTKSIDRNRYGPMSGHNDRARC